jgi:toxin ParE1/3/4
MTVRILRHIKAVEDAEGIADFIAQNSLEAAIRFLENTEATFKYLARSPSIGGAIATDRPDLANLRTCRVKGFPNHVIFYIEHPNSIEIVRIMHGSRDLESELQVDT